MRHPSSREGLITTFLFSTSFILDIQRWITSVMHVDNDNDDKPWRDFVASDWQIAVQIAHAKLLTASTHTRLAFLRDDLTWLTNQGMSRRHGARSAHTL